MKNIMDKFIQTGSIRHPEGFLKKILLLFIIGITIAQIWVALYGSLSPFFHNSVFMPFMLAITFIIYSSSPVKKDKKFTIPIIDVIISLAILVIGIYMFINHNYFSVRWPLADPLSSLEMIIGILLILIVYEVTRRTLGMGMLMIVSLLILYCFLGHLIPGTFGHQEITLMMFVDQMAFTMNGVFGPIASVAATYVFFFVLFGKLFNASGGGDFFYALSKAITGRVSGGPAKVAVISSGLFGSISGSPTADVVTTGSFTVPSMKKAGYSSTYAGAIEAAAGTGGSFLPPIMGSAAFLMVEFTGIPYGSIIMAAIVPGLLYYFTIFLQVHLQAKKMKLDGNTKEAPLSIWKVFMTMGQFAIPIIILIWFLLSGFTPTLAAIIASAATVLVSFFKKNTRLTPKKLIRTLYEAVTMLSPLIAVCAAAGLVVGVVNITGLAGKFSALIHLFAGNNIFLILLVTAILCIIFGMGMPTPAAYVLTAVLAAPALVESGIPVLPAHLFIVYFSCLSAITPPVAVAAYAASAIADTNPIKIAVLAVRLGIIGFIVPFMFVYNTGLILEGSFSTILIAVLTAFLGAIALAIGFEGWFGQSLNKWQRIFLLFGGLGTIYPGYVNTVICVIIIGIILLPRISLVMQDIKAQRLPKSGNSLM